MTEPGPNDEQIRYWNEVSGPKWVRLADVVNAQIEGLGRSGMDALALEEGLRVLDVGCGCGQTSLELAARVGSDGAVTGLDISGPMLEDARRRAAASSAGNVDFVQSDAQMHAFEAGSFDRLFSRFGVMFFRDPEDAFRNLRGALAVDGRLVFVCWQAPDRNPWMTIPLAAVARHVEMPAPPTPGGPGPFAFADPERVEAILTAAGFVDVKVEPLVRDVVVAGGLNTDQATEFLLEMGPTGAAVREAPEAVRQAAAKSVREAIAEFETPEGLLMGAAVWVVSAKPR